MNLTINRDIYKISDGELNILMDYIHSYFFIRLNSLSPKVRKWDMYITNLLESNNKKFTTNTRSILIMGINTLKCIKKPNEIIIRLDYHYNCPGFDAKLYDMCKFIEYGNSETKGLHIFTDTFEYAYKILKLYL